jgi:alpha-L-fucosidase
MERRNFCKLIGAAAAVSALPVAALASGEAAAVAASGEAQAGAGGEASASVASGFNTAGEDYAQFCATPAARRTFYALRDGKIVKETLDQAGWKPTAWGEPPELPIAGGSFDGVPMQSPYPALAGQGPYQPTWDSMLQYEAPEWYRDAKFGMWAHWTPQCVPEAGDWYARNMYMEKNKDYAYQVEHYGDPSQFGYKDLCPQWTLLNWEPDALIDRYKKAGAKIFFSLANHHDSFDCWDSKHQPWNASVIGPHKDVVGIWAAAARKQNMRFGVTVHQARNWWWFQTSHGAATAGAKAGVPFDGDLVAAEGKEQWWQGMDPQRLYGAKHPYDALPDTSYVKNFYDRTRDLIDQHDPDLLYFDNSLVPLGWGGMNIAAYFYNHNLQTHGGKMEAVLNGKQVPDRLTKALVADLERGLTPEIVPHPWQSETCIGDWHYNRALFDKPGEFGGYLPPRDVIHWLVDTVSKNGTFILNVPGKPDGTIDTKEIAVLDGITSWMQMNGEAIYETRPWTVYGEGPDTVKSGSFQGDSISKLGVKDIRFTRNKANTVVYAIVLGVPEGEFMVQSLGTGAAAKPGKIVQVELIGTDDRVKWKQESAGLRVELPKSFRPQADFAAALRVRLG